VGRLERSWKLESCALQRGCTVRLLVERDRAAPSVRVRAPLKFVMKSWSGPWMAIAIVTAHSREIVCSSVGSWGRACRAYS
jgi:hypothetical protein